MFKITAIILTKDEEIHIERCIKNLSTLADEVVVVDSGSTDRTKEISEKLGAKVFDHPFETQAKQFNWATDNISIKGEWILRLDADEYLTEELKEEIINIVKESTNVDGYYIKRRVHFMGRFIKHGGFYPTSLLRLFRYRKGRYEEKEMDEHIKVTGDTSNLKHDFVDENKKGLKFFIDKHVLYASREARDFLEGISQKKEKEIYYKFPMFFRAFLYFIYRYFVLLGFLDGVEGLIFHTLQGFWYRFLVDVKIWELKRNG